MKNEYNFLDYCGKISKKGYDFENKAQCILMNNLYKINELSQFITYENLPDTIPQRVLEQFLIINGCAMFTEIDGKYYILVGGKGGLLDYNFQPTRYIFSNPYLRESGSLEITNEPETKEYEQYTTGEGVLIRNDSLSIGAYPLINKYNTLITEVDLTIRNAITLFRAGALCSATSKKTAEAVNEWINGIKDGKMSAVVDTSFTDSNGSINVQPIFRGDAGYLNSLIEMKQYLQSTLDNKLGINCNFNMKRETLSTAECTLNDQSVIPFILDMFSNRVECIKKINEKYGLNIICKLNNLWAENVEESEVVENVEESELVENVEESELVENVENVEESEV